MIRGLYAITDSALMPPKRFASMLRLALEGGARVIQYRDKSQHHELRWQQATKVVELCRQYNAVSIINDDVELAKVVAADGVHVGRDDESLAFARAELGSGKLIGVSCYSDLDSAAKAVADGADYVAFGSIFASPTKPQAPQAGLQVLQQAQKMFAVPVVAIGGIGLHNIADVIEAGADSAAVISAVFGADDVQQATQLLSNAFVD